jgi:hypothetical protein
MGPKSCRVVNVLCSRVSQCWTIVFHVVPDQARVVPDPMSGFQSKLVPFQTLSHGARFVSCAELYSQVPEYVSSVTRDVSAKAVVHVYGTCAVSEMTSVRCTI